MGFNSGFMGLNCLIVGLLSGGTSNREEGLLVGYFLLFMGVLVVPV